MASGKKSGVWEYFKLLKEEEMTECELCHMKLSFKGKTTSTMRKHLTGKHNKNLQEGSQNGSVLSKPGLGRSGPRQLCLEAFSKKVNLFIVYNSFCVNISPSAFIIKKQYFVI